jgi:lipopolysaccharide transport system ATP-binding protein
MSDTVISVEHISKKYRLGVIGTGTFRDDLKIWAAKLRGKPNPLSKIGETDYGNRSGDTLMALDDVSFTVNQGEALGIIGRNGAGKSTLLKILSRVTTPTSGKIKVKGRIASLLEVGTGFHPELTGRENIFLNGAILGMTRAEVTRKFDEIVDFSGVEKFIDTPVKRYSSGMYVRLAFAVAAHLDPEILIVDEVLAVGDAEFQKKCLGKMGDVAKEGRTVLFVSHNMSAIQDLCKDVIWINKGIIKQRDRTSNVVSSYLSINSINIFSQKWNDITQAPGNNIVRLTSAEIKVPSGFDINYLTIETPLEIIIQIYNYRPDLKFVFNIHLNTLDGICVFNSYSSLSSYSKGIVEAHCFIPQNFLNDKKYNIDFMADYAGATGVEVKNLLNFEIHETHRGETNWYGEWFGVTRPTLTWNVFPIN